MVVGVAIATNAIPLALLDLAMATCPCRSKWCTSSDKRVLQDNVLPRITHVATKIMSQHQEVVATCAIATFVLCCYKVQPLLLHGLFVAIGYITTQNVVANSHFYNAFALVPQDNITALLID